MATKKPFSGQVRSQLSRVAALLGTGKLTPLTTGGRVAAPWKEALVGAGLVSLTLAMIGGCLLLLLGLRRTRV
jgi:hypothetical protein